MSKVGPGWGNGAPVWQRAYAIGPAAAKGAAEAARARTVGGLKFIVIESRKTECGQGADAVYTPLSCWVGADPHGN